MAEKMENGVISEEALEQVAGGLKVDPSTLKKILMGAGVAVGAAAIATAGGAVGYHMGKKRGTKEVEPILEESFSKVFPHPSSSGETSGTFQLN